MQLRIQAIEAMGLECHHLDHRVAIPSMGKEEIIVDLSAVDVFKPENIMYSICQQVLVKGYENGKADMRDNIKSLLDIK
jgi:hypothetical protein